MPEKDRHAPGRQMHVRIPEDLAKQAEEVAARETRSLSNLLVHALRAYVEQHAPARPKPERG